MRKILYIFFALFIITACSSKQEEQKIDIAGQTAKNYYDYLLQGKYRDFVAGMAGAEKADDTYRQQLIENAAMYIGQMKKEHQGITKIEKQYTKLDEQNHSAQVFLTLKFADNTQESIVVPMIQQDTIWYMK